MNALPLQRIRNVTAYYVGKRLQDAAMSYAKSSLG